MTEKWTKTIEIGYSAHLCSNEMASRSSSPRPKDTKDGYTDSVDEARSTASKRKKSSMGIMVLPMFFLVGKCGAVHRLHCQDATNSKKDPC
jgi:hypothetical protein